MIDKDRLQFETPDGTTFDDLREHFRSHTPDFALALDEVFDTDHYDCFYPDGEPVFGVTTAAFRALTISPDGLRHLIVRGAPASSAGDLAGRNRSLLEATRTLSEGRLDPWLYNSARDKLQHAGLHTWVLVVLGESADGAISPSIYYPKMFESLIFELRDRLVSDPVLRSKVSAEIGKKTMKLYLQADAGLARIKALQLVLTELAKHDIDLENS